MIYPYKWHVTTYWHAGFTTWIVTGTYTNNKGEWHIPSYQDDKDDKDDMSEIDEYVRIFWRKRGAM